MSDKPRHIWITRTAASAPKSAALWRAAGFTTSLFPLLQVSPAIIIPSEPKQDSLLVFTSGNGVNAYAALGYSADHPVITVGDATAQTARNYGFKDVVSAGGTSQNVTDLIVQNTPKSIPIIHCAGQTVRGFISEDLRKAGYDVRRDIYYETSEAPKVLLDIANIDVIAFYSPLGAKAFSKHYKNLDLTDVTALSLSAAIDVELNGLNFSRRLVSPQPNETAMQGLLLGGPER